MQLGGRGKDPRIGPIEGARGLDAARGCGRVPRQGRRPGPQELELQAQIGGRVGQQGTRPPELSEVEQAAQIYGPRVL